MENNIYKQSAEDFILGSDLFIKLAAFDLFENIRYSLNDYIEDVKGNFQDLKNNPRQTLSKIYSSGGYRSLRDNYNTRVSNIFNKNVANLERNININPNNSWASE